MAIKKEKTSWGKVAAWYDEYLEGKKDSYQRQVILPNLLRLVAPRKGLRVLDIACGQGFFTRAFREAGALADGVDIAPELIAIARARSARGGVFLVAPADNLSFAKDVSYDVATIVLAIQNIKNLAGSCSEAARVLVPGGRFIIVMNHPAFRVPKHSDWDFEETDKTQYRRVGRYLSAFETKIDMHPGKRESAQTISYHRSLQDYAKALVKEGFAVVKIEEWISHKRSERGPRQKAEDIARKEIPLFLMIEAKKCEH
ncbi:MAG: methyltransferase domain-containing protein [Patescibacteria group bacterium]|nr:methyltransferase domain-containing protein [Patescibacteria group bacterium]